MRMASWAALSLAAGGVLFAWAWPAATADDTKGKSEPPAATPAGQAKPVLPNRKQIMLDKLTHSQAVLTGLARRDWELIKTSSDKLVAYSQLAEWLNADKGDEYQFQMTLFRRAARAIGSKAQEKNVDGVMLAYTEMTLTCVRCHQYERDWR
jgi:hypothetical protein